MATVGGLIELVMLVVSNFATLTLAAIGLAIIFGMMGIINIAHGEFIMVGAYATALSYRAGVPLAGAILIGGVAVAVLGGVLERLVIRRLYDRLIDSVVATWGISLLLSQFALVLFGSTIPGIPTPFGSLRFAGTSVSLYKLVLAGAAVALLVVTYVLFMHTDYGLRARATMQLEETARSQGVDTRQTYFVTFVYGSFLTGIAGGLFAPTISIVPSLGGSFLIEAFVTVIVGGANALVGTPTSALLLGGINGTVSQWGGTFAGRIALLVTVIVVIRLLPRGISGYWTGETRR